MQKKTMAQCDEESREWLAKSRKIAEKRRDLTVALADIINAANTNPQPIHYKVREAIDRARELLRS